MLFTFNDESEGNSGVHLFQRTEAEMHKDLLSTKMFTGLLFIIQKFENCQNIHPQ